MKKCTLLLLFACLSISYLQAQSFKYGVKAGLNTSNFAVSPEVDPPGPSARLGVHIGGFAQLGLAGNFSIQPELTFSTQGANDEDAEEWHRVRLSYINLAAPFKYTLDNKLHFSVGPQLGFLSGGTFEEEDKAEGDIKIQNADYVLAGTDLSLGVGVGYTLDSGILLHLRYNHGLTDLNDDPADLGFYEPVQRIRSRVFQLSVGYIFNY